jgi:hypothetical protein
MEIKMTITPIPHHTSLHRNSIDEQLEVAIDVLDDFVGESVEVAKVNGWLAYGPPLHLLREFGTTCRDFDMIDEQPCTGDQIKNICWKM